MANQRPIRRAPFPRFRRGRRRPVRWIEGNSTSAGLTACAQAVVTALCDPSPPRKILLDGDSDWEWADKNNVRIDRLVGQINWYAVASNAEADPVPFNLRMGVLAVEDGDAPTLDLWDRETIEEYEWMWLYSTVGDSQWIQTGISAATLQVRQQETIPVDIRTRRSLGKKDQVLFYAQCKIMSSNEFEGLALLPNITMMLRAIIRS